MTLNQLIEYINDCSGSHSEQLPVNAAKRIIAALKAGQAMRGAIEKEWDSLGLLQTEEACAAWDAATSNPLDELAALGQEMAKELGEEY